MTSFWKCVQSVRENNFFFKQVFVITIGADFLFRKAFEHLNSVSFKPSKRYACNFARSRSRLSFFLVFALRNCAYERRLTEEVALVSSLKDCTSTNGGMKENTIKRFVTESRQQKQSWIIYFFCNVVATITCLFSFKIVRRSRSLMWSECWCLSIGKELLAVLHVVDFFVRQE